MPHRSQQDEINYRSTGDCCVFDPPGVVSIQVCVLAFFSIQQQGQSFKCLVFAQVWVSKKLDEDEVELEISVSPAVVGAALSHGNGLTPLTSIATTDGDVAVAVVAGSSQNWLRAASTTAENVTMSIKIKIDVSPL